MNPYLILVLVGFVLVGAGTIGYYQSTVIKETKTDKVFTVMDAKTGEMINQRFCYDVTKEWKIVRREE